MEPVILSCAELSTREINAALTALPDGATARVLEPRGRHNLAGPTWWCTASPAGRSGRTCRPGPSG